MKKTIYFLFTLLAIISVETYQMTNTIDLGEGKIFPIGKNDIFFKTTPILKSNKDGNVYFLDNLAHSLYKTDKDGNLQFSKTNQGQGPGDLQFPSKMDLTESGIIVWDFNGISVFNLNGDFDVRFRTFREPLALACSTDTVYVVERNNMALITAYDYRGNIRGEFGKKYSINLSLYNDPKISAGADLMFHLGNLVFNNEKIYYISQLFGDIFVYDNYGKLINKKEFENLDTASKNKKAFFQEGWKHNKIGININNRQFNDALWLDGDLYLLAFKYKDIKSEILRLDGQTLAIKNVYQFRSIDANAFGVYYFTIPDITKSRPLYVSTYDFESGSAQVIKYDFKK